MNDLFERLWEEEGSHIMRPGNSPQTKPAHREAVRPKREDECLTLDHWRMRAYDLEANWSRCSRACTIEQTKREQAEAHIKRLAESLRECMAFLPDRGLPGIAKDKARALLRDQEEGRG